MAEEQRTMVPEELIQVVRLPEIAEQLQTVRGQWDAIVAECRAMDCTTDTLSVVKERRSAVNKAFDALEARRKAVKKAVMAPYDALDAIYKECVTEPHDQAEAALKAKIAAVEEGVKADCEARMRRFFTEMRQKERVEWLTWEMGGFKIDMASARAKVPAKLQGQIADFVVRVSGEVRTISGMEDAAEIMDEYKRTRDLAGSIRIVRDRKARIVAERQAAADREAALRQEQEAVTKADAAVGPPVTAPVPERPPFMADEPAPAPTSMPTESSGTEAPGFPPSIRFTLWLDTREQWEAVRPALTELRRVLEQEGVRHEGPDVSAAQARTEAPAPRPDREEADREPYPWEY